MAYMKDSTGRKLDSFEVVGVDKLGGRSKTGLITPRTRRRFDEFALQPVASRTMVTTGTMSSTFVGPGKSNGVDTRGMYRTIHGTMVPFHHPRLVHGNVLNNNGTEAPGDNPITISASVELPASGGFIQVTWGGQTSVTIAPGAFVTSDPIGFSASVTGIPLWYTRTYVSVASAGMTWPLTLISQTGDAAERGTANNDKTMGGTVASSYERIYAPAAIIGVPEVDTPSVAIVGDSIAQGYNETNFNSFVTQALTALKIPHMNFAAGSEMSGKWVNNIGRSYRSALLRYCTHVIFENGFNSLATSWTNVQNTQVSAWNYLSSLGLTVFQTTITPGTTSTDNWATLANQTVLASPQEANRTLLNDYIRTTPAPLSGFIETADTAMTARNSGFWKSDGTANKWTSDGAHPSTYGHAQLSAAIQPQITALLAANP